MRRARRITAAAIAAALTAPLTGCGGGGSANKTLVVATHDSWAMPQKVIARFEKRTGWKVQVQPQGDAGQLTNKLVLTKDSPIADVAYGVDNTFASRAVQNGVFERYRPAHQPASARRYALPGKEGARLAPVDFGDVCVNIDDTWFAKKHLRPPRTLGDLTKSRYRNLFVTPGAATSSPGMAFLIATIGKEGNGWRSYWKRLVANGAKVVSGWTDAYEVDFTAGGGDGNRPIVLSYSSSPPFTIPKGSSQPTTSALLDTCFRQVEYAGVVSGTEHQRIARKFVDFLQSAQVQRELPENMYVYPVDSRAEIPAAWRRYAPVAKDPVQMPPGEIARRRDTWLRQWRDLTSG